MRVLHTSADAETIAPLGVIPGGKRGQIMILSDINNENFLELSKCQHNYYLFHEICLQYSTTYFKKNWGI